MNNVSSQLMHLEQSGLKMNALAVMADINPSLMYRMRDGLRPCSFENALKLHAVTNGRFSVEQTHPKALCLVKSIFKKQGESNGLETQHGKECQTSRSSDAAETTYMEGGAVAQSSAEKSAQY